MEMRSSPTGSVHETSFSGMVRVWDPIVRAFHWTVVAGCTANLLLDGGALHRAIGYTVAAATAVRIGWGFVGTPYARFSAFLPTWDGLRRYVAKLVEGRAPRYVGHNPLGALMMATLLVLLSAVCITGWMMGLDAFWGNETLEALHEACATAVLCLAPVHALAAVLVGSHHRENLVLAMLTGCKRMPSGNDIENAAHSHRG